MARLTTCDKCGTDKHDNTVARVTVEQQRELKPGLDLSELGVDLCHNHRAQLKTWLLEVDIQDAPVPR